MFISRIADNNRKQSTAEHLTEVSELASKWAEVVGFTQTSRIAALLHDMGKFSNAFVTYLQKQDKSMRGSVIHSTQGAKYIYETAIHYNNNYAFVAEMIGLCIAGHHGVLMDGLTPNGETPYLNRICIRNTKNLYFDEVKTEFTKNLDILTDLNKFLDESSKEIKQFIEVCHTNNLNAAFMIHMLTKFMFSCLVDADRYSAYCFETSIKMEFSSKAPQWEDLSHHLDTFLTEKNNKSDKTIDRLRREVSDKCFAAANLPCGIYQLEVPTGGGKTLSSLRFALNHIKVHGKERVIYVIPYLSILEQTADDIREALGLSADDPSILEHHSNLIPSDDEEKARNIKLLTDRWDAPIIITTAVQFLESVFSEKASGLRKLHNMANSVIIFDEVQSLPIKCINLFNDAANFLSIFGKSTILLCTATQPLLDSVEHPICLSQQPNLIVKMEYDFSVLCRTRIKPNKVKHTYKTLVDFILEKQHINMSCLVILNTKKNVTTLFKTLKMRLSECEQDIKLYHLSTLMCPAHRLNVLNDVKVEIKNHRPVICISSQLIEAGVDISFGCVVRAYAGLDSIAQAAGRCNRHGEDPHGRDVYIVNLDDENLSRLPDIKIGADITKRIIDEEFTDLLSKQALERYYNEYFYKRTKEMNYNIGRDGNLYDLLSVNNKGRSAYKNRPHYGMRPPTFLQALQTAGENFYIIENNTTSVLVPYGEGTVLAENYQHAALYQKSSMLRKMGRFSVSLYRYQIDKLNDAGALLKLNDDLILLDKDFYNEERGVDLEKDIKFQCY